MPVETSPDGKKLILKHPKGSSAEILLFGATVISWKSPTWDISSSPTPVERLFVSSKAKLDGTKAVRGGIPVVFPFFGAPTKPEHEKLPQHGFARSEMWQWDGTTVMDHAVGVSVQLTFIPYKSLTDDAVHLSYVVTLSEHQLSTDLHVTNTSSFPLSKPLSFQALLHTYLLCPSQSIRVTNLKGLIYTDKTVAGTPRKTEERDLVDVKEFTDFVYEDAPGAYEVQWEGGGMRIKSIGMKDVVVWNPRETGSKMGDMEDGGWDRFVCVEPGYVAGWATLEAGQTWIGGQTLTAIRPQTQAL